MNSLIRFAPNVEMRRLQREIDSLFDNFFPVRGERSEEETAVWSPRVDISETDDAYLLHLDVPGVDRENLSINYNDGSLTVSGERKAEMREEKQSMVRIERMHGRFFRSFTLPKAVKAENISASYNDGVLTITVPKAEESKPRRIEIS